MKRLFFATITVLAFTLTGCSTYQYSARQAGINRQDIQATPTIVDVKADLLDLPFQDEEFDVVFCNHVLEHIIEDKKAMKELYRVLKPGGWGILQVPLKRANSETYEDFSITDPKERQIHFGQYDHVRWYAMDYFTRLESVGFEVEILEYSKTFSKKEQMRYGLSENEILPIVRKNKSVIYP